MNQQEGIGAGRVSRLCAGYTMIEIKSFENINKSTVYNGKKMFEEFMRNWCRRMHLDSWKWYTHKTSGFKTSGFITSGFKTFETSGLQNVRFTKRQVYKMSGLKNVRSSKGSVAKKHP